MKSLLSSLALLVFGVAAGALLLFTLDRDASPDTSVSPAETPPVLADVVPSRTRTILRIQTDPHDKGSDDDVLPAAEAGSAQAPGAATNAAPQFAERPVSPSADPTGGVAAAAPALPIPSDQLPEVRLKARTAHVVPVPPPEPGTRPRSGSGFDAQTEVRAKPPAATPQTPPKSVSGRAEVSGSARVVDGETLEIGGQRIRLFGIGAPDLRQECNSVKGAKWRCGQESRAALAQLVASAGTVRCTPRTENERGELTAVCVDGQGVDLAARQVISGNALARRGISLDYVDQETIAQTARRGLWQGEFERPWEWKRNHPAS